MYDKRRLSFAVALSVICFTPEILLTHFHVLIRSTHLPYCDIPLQFCSFKYIILVINVTAACVRGCVASIGFLVTGKEKKRGRAKRTTDSKSNQLMGIQAIIKEMCVGGGVSELH